jgi:hypothetical protein
VGELVMVLQSRIGGRGLLRCSWSMASTFQHLPVRSLGASSELPLRPGSDGLDRWFQSRVRLQSE